MNKTLTIVAAMGRNRGIGIDGGLPWRLPGELQHFKATTMGCPIVMGRRTWESIGRALPGRQNIVVSRNPALDAPGCQLAASLVHAVEIAEGYEVMIIGGGELYRQALPLASRLVLTLVECSPEADTWFPEWDATQWLLVSSERHPSSGDAPAWEVCELQRKNSRD
jgi:dihydrofolate reductase